MNNRLNVVGKEELVEFTGKKQPAAQVRVLNHMGISHLRRPDGTVVLLFEAISGIIGEGKQGIKRRSSRKSLSVTEPNLCGV